MPCATANLPFIVGLGASAGGLEALEHFLTRVPADSGIAYVVIQHLDPTQKGMLPELLQRATKMPVYQAANQLKVKANCVYVIPPNKDMSILHGTLTLHEPVEPRGLRLPIDFFLRALAQDQGSHAVGVILSGMGSDGTLGLKAIKEKAGLTLVQQPASAKFDPMPRSAIDADVADIVAPVDELPARIIAYLKHVQTGDDAVHMLDATARNGLEKVVTLLREHTGSDFSLYKTNTMYRRIERRMGLHQIATLNKYVSYLRENPQEINLLFKELLIGVTSFFRDPAVWDYLKKEALPALLAQYPSGKVVRVWVPACSSGEEAYSLAMVFKEVLEQIKPKAKFLLQVFATDLDSDAIDKARQGFYPTNIASDVSAERLRHFFIEEQGGYRVAKAIREMVIFAPQNIIMDPPFTKLDIISCRNLLIYLGMELQKKLVPLFHYALNSNGLLLLGSAETVGNFTDLFAPLDSKARLYHRIDIPSRLGLHFPTKDLPLTQMAHEESKTEKSAGNLQQQADQILLQHFSPPAVLINAEGDILYINGRTGKYLEPAAGKANWNIYAMAHDGLRYELAHALKTAARKHAQVSVDGLQVTSSQGVMQCVNLTVYPIVQQELLRDMFMIVFSEVDAGAKVVSSKASAPTTRTAAQMAELKRVRDEMQIMREELTSANEELQSTNEELQSTNEELTTSKEEMQSMNEELQSVNAELQSKMDDLAWVNNDMKNLLNSTEIATIFLDNALNVRRFTTHATRIFKLIVGDVGRPLSDIVTDLDYAELQADVKEVLQTLVFVEKQKPTRDGRWYKVRVMPYRTLENVIDGVVITFSDITEMKVQEAELRKLAK